MCVVAVHTIVLLIIVGGLIFADAALFPPALVKKDKTDSHDPVSETKSYITIIIILLIIIISCIFQETGELQTFYFIDCRKDSILTRLFQAVIVVHVFIVHLFGLFFAFKTRKIKIMVLNEYKYTLAFILTSVVAMGVMMIALRFVEDDPTYFSFCLSLTISSLCLLNLGLIFIPKVHKVHE